MTPSRRPRFTTANIGTSGKKGIDVDARSLQLSQRHSQRQMSLFNMSVCFARCGYMDSAV